MKKNLLAILTAAVLTSGMAQATNYPAGSVTLNGSVVGTTCTFTLTGTGASGNTFTLPPVPVSTFTGINTEAGQTDFNVDLNNCGTLSVAQLMFSGTADSNQTDSFVNAATSTPATGVAIRLKSAASGNTFSPNIGTNDGAGLINNSVTLYFRSQYVQTTATLPTEGNVLTNATLNLIY